MDERSLQEFETLLEVIERDLSIEQYEDSLPRLLELTASDVDAKTRLYCVGSRCYYAGREPRKCEQMLDKALAESLKGGVEAKARVDLTEASLLTTMEQFMESEEKIAHVLPVLSELSIALQTLALAIHGRNEALTGSYAEAITHSQDAIARGPRNSSSAAFANMTIAIVLQVMERFEESERFVLEQVRIYTERGSKKNIAASYSVLASGAASVQNWSKAIEYQKKATVAMGDVSDRDSTRPLMLYWMANAEIDLGNPQKALEYGGEALALAEEMGDKTRLLHFQVFLGHARLANKDYEGALDILLRALNTEGPLGDNTRIGLYQFLAQAYQALDRRAEAFDICYRLWELQREFDNRTREALLRYEKALEKKIHFQEMDLMKAKTDSIERELSLQAMNMAAQTDLLVRFRDDLRGLVRQVSDPGAALNQVREKLKALPCEQIDWSKFETQFVAAHPEFRTLLVEKFPSLTRQELRLCQLLRVGMKSFEAARLLCISERSVESHRFNIRKKLLLTKEQSMTEFLQSLS